MRTSVWGILVLVGALAVAGSGQARAQENPEQLKKAYQDALEQLKSAQERKNQLAADNEKLVQQIDTLKKQLAVAQNHVEEMKRTDAEHAERTFFLRSHYQAWQAFLRLHPDLLADWRVFLGSDLFGAPRELPEVVDPQWPTSGKG